MCHIGFIEGGEFNAVVSMKVHNKAQITQIEAEYVLPYH